MSGINKAVIVGRIGKDPEIRYLADGTAVASLSVATSKQWKDKVTGEKKEATEWHKISLFGKSAELAGQYMQKGDLAGFEGEIRTRKWQDKEGVDRYTTEIHATEMHFLTSKGDREERPGQSGSSQRPAAKTADAKPASGGAFADFTDDIPF